MNARHLLILLTILSIGLSLSASTVCEAPAPASGQIIDQASDFASVSWSAVPNALSYQVETTETSTGTLVASEVVYNTTYSRGNLNPGEEYSFNIRASYCQHGPFGEGLAIHFQTEVIVVDVILQMECAEGTTDTGSYSVGDIMTIDLSEGGCYQLSVKTLTSNPQIEIDLAITRMNNGNGPVLIGNFASNPNEFNMYGNGPVAGVMNFDEGNLPLFNMNSINILGNTYLRAGWLQDVEVTLTRCPSCELTLGGGMHPLEMEGDIEPETPISVKLAPNPVQDVLQLDLDVAGQVEIWDMTGRRWASLGKENPQVHYNLDVRNWPAGTYIVRWHSPDNPPGVQYFLKHDM